MIKWLCMVCSHLPFGREWAACMLLRHYLHKKRSVLRVCTLLLSLSLQILVHLINSNCHSSDLSGRSVLVVNTFGCCLVDDACCA